MGSIKELLTFSQDQGTITTSDGRLYRGIVHLAGPAPWTPSASPPPAHGNNTSTDAALSTLPARHRAPPTYAPGRIYNLQESLLQRGPLQHDLDAGTRTHTHAYMHTQHVRKPAWLPRGILTALSGFPNANNNLFYGITLVTAPITFPARTRCYDRWHTRPGWQGSRCGRHCVITAQVAHLHRFSRAHSTVPQCTLNSVNPLNASAECAFARDPTRNEQQQGSGSCHTVTHTSLLTITPGAHSMPTLECDGPPCVYP